VISDGQGGSWIRARYEKLLALAVFAALLASLLYLALRIGTLRRRDAEFDRRVAELAPLHPGVEGLSTAQQARAVAVLRDPSSLPAWTNFLTVPETRVWCVDCKRPIPFAALTCFFCNSRQPIEGGAGPKDSDGDGIPDDDEKRLGLDPLNAADGREDPDGDRFSNADEYRSGKDLRDAGSHPEVEPFLDVLGVEAIPFQFLFKSCMRGPKGMTFAHLRRMQVDIECVTTKGYDFCNAEREGDRIIAVALADQSGWTEVLSGAVLDEKTILEQMVKIIRKRDPDVIEGHNIFGFDLPYLALRAARHHVRLALGRDGSEPAQRPSRFSAGEHTVAYTRFEIHGRHDR